MIGSLLRAAAGQGLVITFAAGSSLFGLGVIVFSINQVSYVRAFAPITCWAASLPR